MGDAVMKSRRLRGAATIALAVIVGGWPAPLWVLAGPLKEWPDSFAWAEWYLKILDWVFGIDRTSRIVLPFIWGTTAFPLSLLMLFAGVVNLFSRPGERASA